MKKIKGVFIRHGLSEANVQLRIAGQTDAPLSELGRDKLIKIKHSTNYPNTDLYFSSDLSRAKSTSEVLFSKRDDLVLREDFRECYFGDLEWKLFSEVDLETMFHNWYDGKVEYNMESLADFSYRINNGLISIFDELVSKDLSSFTLVSHFCVMRQIKIFLINLDKQGFIDFYVKNGRGFIADIDYDENSKKLVNVTLSEI